MRPAKPRRGDGRADRGASGEAEGQAWGTPGGLDEERPHTRGSIPIRKSPPQELTRDRVSERI